MNAVAVGFSELPDSIEAFGEAARMAAEDLDGQGVQGPPDLCLIMVPPGHLAEADQILEVVHEWLAPRQLIGCGAAGLLAGEREYEGGGGAVVWAASLPGGTIHTHHLLSAPGVAPSGVEGLPTPAGGRTPDALLMLADPYSFAMGPALERIHQEFPGMPVLGGLSSAALGGSGCMFIDDRVVIEGAVSASIDGVDVLPCVSQGATPVGPEMTITAAEGNVLETLASKPAMERLGEVVVELPPNEREMASSGLMLGVVIDENQPAYERGDFLVRPVVGADRETGTVAIGQQVRVGQTVRLHVRDAASADSDLRAALRDQVRAMGSDGIAGALVFTCNGRGEAMFGVPDHDASTIQDALDAPAAGFFCAGEIGPVGGRNFLHGFTATMAVFAAKERHAR